MIDIPLSLRPDDMTVKNPATSDYGGEYLDPFLVKRVRFESAAALINSGYVLSDGAAGVVYTGSEELDIQVGALITLRGNDYSVVKVIPYEAYRGKLHHYEIEVA